MTMNQPTTKDELDEVLACLGEQYRFIEEKMLNPVEKTLQMCRKELEHTFGKYVTVQRMYTMGIQDDIEKTTYSKDYERELRYYQEFQYKLQECCQRCSKPALAPSLITRSSSHSGTSNSFKSIGTDSSRRIKAIALREKARLKLKQQIERESLEDERIQVERKLSRQKNAHQYELACAEVDAWEIGEERIDILETSFHRKPDEQDVPNVVENRQSLIRSRLEEQVSLLSREKGEMQMDNRLLGAAAAETPKYHKEAEISQGQGFEYPGCNMTRRVESRKALIQPQITSLDPSHTRNNEERSDLMEIATALRNASDLPKLELLTFDGSPKEYTRFIRNFEKNIESRVSDGYTRLTYLLQYCKGDAKESILHCASFIDGNEGYKTAKSILQSMFGRTFTIGRQFLEELNSNPYLKRGDSEGLITFSRKLQQCYITLRNLDQSSELENFDNLAKIASKLPPNLLNDWIKLSANKEKQNVAPSFHDLVVLVADAVECSNSNMAKVISSINKDQSTQRASGTKYKYYANATSATAECEEIGTEGRIAPKEIGMVCPDCNGSHSLKTCSTFSRKDPDDKYKLIRISNICANCFVPGHIARNCKWPNACAVKGCNAGKHHTLLHRNESNTTDEEGVQRSVVSPRSFASTVLGRGVYLNVVPVRVSSQSGIVLEVWAFLDPGSSVCFCSKKLINMLSADTRQISYSSMTIHGTKTQTGEFVDLTIESLEGSSRVYLEKVLSTDKIPASANRYKDNPDVERYPHLSGIDFPSLSCDEVHLLIGSNVSESLWTEESREGKSGEPVAQKSPWGWSLIGPMRETTSDSGVDVINFIRIQDVLTEQIEELWNTDFKDVALTPQPVMSKEDRYALNCVKDGIRRIDGHYEVPLPWRPGCPKLPNNRPVAEKRLSCLHRRLSKDSVLKEKYCNEMQKFIDKGFARIVPEREIDAPEGKTWYLPHQPVLSERKPGKVRLVFDAASQFRNTSLNQQLLQGADLANSLLGVLLRFRQGKYAILADITAMFLMVKVNEKDWNTLRFLFWPRGDLTKNPVEYNMMVMNFGNSCSPFCANYCLRQTAIDFGQNYPPDIARNVERRVYVDDFLLTADTVEEGRRIARQTQELVAQGGFHLSKWMSNHSDILEDIPIEDRAPLESNIDLDANNPERVLGVQWSVQEDCFLYHIKLKSKPKTKRGVLSVLCSVYDPMGLVSPVILTARLLFQNLCRLDISWDEQIPDDIANKWSKWMNSLSSLSELRVNRCVLRDTVGGIQSKQLHHFGDASKSAYGTASYIRVKDAAGKVHCTLLLARARICPMKAVCTLPRLELTAAALAVKMDQCLRKELDMDDLESYFWTDSTSVLQSIHNTSTRFPTFVANRVSKIEDGSKPQQWRYVPTKLNPADYASRGMDPQDLVTSKVWLEGPAFLYKEESEWPATPINLPQLPDEFVTVKTIVASAVQATQDPLDRFIKRFSSWYKLVKATAWMIRFKKYLQDKGHTALKGNLSPREMEAATISLIRYVQGKQYESVIAALSSLSDEPGKRVLRKHKIATSLLKLNPGLIDDVLRVIGRLRNSTLKFETRCPIIIPMGHFADLLIRYYHETSHHCGPSHTWTLLRQKYWLVGGITAVKRVLSPCVICKKRSASALTQVMADLPKERLMSDDAPFSHVGIDNFGPYVVKQGRSTPKRWGLIVTCMASRAVHLEIVHSMDADSCINALRRCMTRRGRIKSVTCDNGGNFIATNRMLQEEMKVWNSTKMGAFYQQEGIEFKFNPPTASHFGGIFERLIRSAKKILSSLLGNQVVTDEVMSTIFCEVEGVLNSRPLTPVIMDAQSDTPLTPNHLLFARSGGEFIPGLFNHKDCYGRRRWRQVQFLTDQFWMRWKQEYLQTLQVRQKWVSTKENLQQNDIVLIVDNTQPRGKWLTGRVTETIKDKLGRVRQVWVMSSQGLLRRPVTKLCMICKAE